MSSVPLPGGFSAHAANVGIKDSSLDFTVIAADEPCSAAAVFTRSRFSGPSVTLSREHVADGVLQAIVVVSKNANVANGEVGEADARELAERVGRALRCAPDDVLVASTGVIGRPYPMERIRNHLARLERPLDEQDAIVVAEALMTTDTHPKVATAKVQTIDGKTANIVGIAKGVGMIEPDMATMLAFVLTDAEVPLMDLRRAFDKVVQRSFNSLSIDTDTSTSDTAALLASGKVGPVETRDFEMALRGVCMELTRQLAADGEGATKLLVVEVTGARDDDQARRVAKSIVNSPLVKTAVHGADPNWGRVAMAVGKCSDDTDIDQRHTRISFGGVEVFPGADPAGAGTDLAALEEYLRGEEVHIGVDLGISDAGWTVYGCDLSDGYVRINADYTT